MTCQMAEYVAAQVAGHPYKCKARRPTSEPPQEIIRSDQRHEQDECQPYSVGAVRAGGQAINEILHPVLCPDRAGHCQDNRGNDDDVRCAALAQVPQHKRKRTVSVSRKIIHIAVKPPEEKEPLSRSPRWDRML